MRPLAAAALVLALTATTNADDKPVKWEYAEVVFRTVPPRGPGKDAEGKEVPASPASMTIRWTSGGGEYTVKGWGELAEKLKVPFKNEGTPSSQKIQMLNLLGAEGWELIDQQGGGATAATFGRGDRAEPGPRGFPSATPTTWLLKRRAR